MIVSLYIHCLYAKEGEIQAWYDLSYKDSIQSFLDFFQIPAFEKKKENK